MNNARVRSSAAAQPARPAWAGPRSLTVLFCSMVVTLGPGCTTLQTVDPGSASGTHDELRAGDAVTVSLRDGRELELRLLAWSEDEIVGEDQAGAVHAIGRDDILQLQVSRVSTVRTILLVSAVAAFVVGLRELVASIAALSPS